MSFQPFQVAAAIDNFVNSRLKEKDREKRDAVIRVPEIFELFGDYLISVKQQS